MSKPRQENDNVLAKIRKFFVYFSKNFKGSPSHFTIEINVETRRIRHRMTQKLNNEFLNRLKID